ncbi:transport and Golgi organization protein 1 homolog isoform X2 [Lutra lutra]|uniref:transport and Golgi organization protein 1 homolog isoform X2 n=1 Tax=Lutra lutra TaxID=9657 RepID=UPI001FD1F03F|nr:transport and Golgi organization protein 1 homolog isoform X2 [Lutra lutra]
MKTIVPHRQEVEEMEDQLLEAELTFNHKIAVQERNAVANWMKARYWETRMMQQSRENAYLKYRLRMMEGEMLPVGSMRRRPMPGRPELQEPLWQAPRPVPRMNGSTSPQRDPEMASVGRGVREFPRCPGPLHMPYHMGRNVPGFPPTQPHLVPPPHGGEASVFSMDAPCCSILHKDQRCCPQASHVMVE